MPNPDGSMTPEERRQAMLATGTQNGIISHHNPTGKDEVTNYNDMIASGNILDGDAAMEFASRGGQDAVHKNLSSAEAAAKLQADFGLGQNNNAATSAMLGDAMSTGDKYSTQFGGDAANAGRMASAANSRGLGIYGADTSQYNAALGNAQQDRGMQTGAYGQLMDFANQGPGASAAEAQLTGATDANTQNALAMARSGRGMGGGASALRGAMAQNAMTQQGANSQMAALRAQENTAYQGQRLQAMGAAGTVAGQTVQADQGTAASGLAGSQYLSDTAIKGTQLNDASSQAWATQKQNAEQQGLGAEMGAQTQALNINATALTGRENREASANQRYATEEGLAQSASTADANRTQAYTAAALQTAGTVMGAISDQRAKSNIFSLGGVAAGPSKPSGGQQAGAMVGKVGGAVAGSAIAGPIGGAVGSFVGSKLGSLLSDERTKTNIVELSGEGSGGEGEHAMRDPNNPSRYISAYQGITDASHSAHGAGGGEFKSSMPYDGPKRELDQANPYEELLSLSSKYGAGGVAEQPKAVQEYASSKPDAKTLQRFAKDGSHPILSEGDKYLAESARNAPPSQYEYKDPKDGPGSYTGPMAQDLITHPATAGIVAKDPTSGKLMVDGTRGAMTALGQNHSQQNQIDSLSDQIAKLESMLGGKLKRKPGDEQATQFATSNGGL